MPCHGDHSVAHSVANAVASCERRPKRRLKPFDSLTSA